MFQRADKNQDGKITKDEVPDQLWERISKADGNGEVTKEELKKALQERTKNRKPKAERKKKAEKR